MRLLLQTLLRLLFPAWGFFDVAGVRPVLEWRRVEPTGPGGAWEPLLSSPPWRWWHAVVHPAGTRHLAEQTLVERATFECLQGDDATESLTLVDHLVTHVLTHMMAQPMAQPMARRATPSVPPPTRWQWRLVAYDQAEPHVVHVREPA